MAKLTEADIDRVTATVKALDLVLVRAQELVFAVFQAQQVPALKMAEARSMAVVLGSVKAMASELSAARARVLAPVLELESASKQVVVGQAIRESVEAERRRALAAVGRARGESGGGVASS